MACGGSCLGLEANSPQVVGREKEFDSVLSCKYCVLESEAKGCEGGGLRVSELLLVRD